MCVGPFRVFGRRNVVVGQSIFQRAFAELRQISQRRQNNIGGDTVELSRAASDPVKFLDGELERAIIWRTAAEERGETADLENGLHRSFAKGVLVADDHRPSIILKGGGEN